MLAESVLKAIEEGGVNTGLAAAKLGWTNKDYEEEHFAGVKGSNYYPFTNGKVKVDADFYKGILAKEENSEQRQVLVTFDTCQTFDLGDRVSFNEKNYVVYRIIGSSKGGTGQNYEHSYELLLLPVNSDGTFYPLPLRDLRIHKSSPQRAIVQSNFDPDKLGRVRVKYFWQDEDNDDYSPWIRVSAPGASKDAGLMFYHRNGDEVLIDYEEGNIDRPYVAGALYSKTNLLPGSSEPHLHGSTHSLSSAHGHHISFMDSKGAAFFTDLLPSH